MLGAGWWLVAAGQMPGVAAATAGAVIAATPAATHIFTSGREDVWTKPGYNGRASLLCGTTRAGDVRPVANMRRMSLGMGGVIGREEG